MSQQRSSILDDHDVRIALKNAWEDSEPGETGGHEEGGFILRDSDGNLKVVRWPKGEKNTISLPPHPNCKFGGSEIVASFHTHPNTGSDFLQEPGETDKRAVSEDPDLKGQSYEGEFVVSQAKIYFIDPDGRVEEVADTQILFQKQ